MYSKMYLHLVNVEAMLCSLSLTVMMICLQVPPELKEDLMLIADKIEPYLLQVKELADKAPEKAHELAAKIEPAAEQLGEKIEQTAEKVGCSYCVRLYSLL